MSGRAVQRRLYRRVPTKASVCWLLSDAQPQLFEGWFDHILISGTMWFECHLKTPLGNIRGQVQGYLLESDLGRRESLAIHSSA